jgi:hypothetical protein
MAVFVANKAGMNYVLRSPEGEVGRYFNKLGQRLTRLAKAQVGVDTGRLRASINYRVARGATGLVVTVGSNNRIALLHHKGARPHIIVPRRAQTLRFYSHGRIVYSKFVHHPGTKPNRYLTDNLRRVI